MIKHLIRQYLPGPYEILRGWRWGLQEWADSCREKPSLEKKAGLAMQKLTRGLDRWPPNPAKGRILFFMPRGWRVHDATATATAVRLRQRGHHVEFLDCEGEIPFCFMGNIHTPKEWRRACPYCLKVKQHYYREHFPHQPLGALSAEGFAAWQEIDRLSLPECQRYHWHGFDFRKLCELNLQLYLCRTTLSEEDTGLYRELLKTAVLIVDRIPVHLARIRPECVVMINGDYAIERVVGEICRRQGVRYVTHDFAWEGKLAVARNDAIWRQMTFDPVPLLEQALSASEQKTVRRFVEAWIRNDGYIGRTFWSGSQRDEAGIRQQLQLDERPLAVAFTNVTTDTIGLGMDTIFKDMLEWIDYLVGYFERRPQWLLVIRCHPAEARATAYRSNERTEDYLMRTRAQLPANIRLVKSESPINSYSLMRMARCGLVYTSTVGLELAMRGRRVILPAMTHYAGRGFTSDARTKKDYDQLIEGEMARPESLSAYQLQRLYSYVYYLFFERMIPFEPVAIDEKTLEPIVRITDAQRFLPGRLVGLETLCDTITKGTPPMIGRRTSRAKVVNAGTGANA